MNPTDSTERVLADTSAWINVLQPAQQWSVVRERIRRLIESDDLVIVAPVRAEVLRGARDDTEFRRLVTTFAPLVRLPTLEQDWDETANLGFR